jgi:hypothetical protein
LRPGSVVVRMTKIDPAEASWQAIYRSRNYGSLLG